MRTYSWDVACLSAFLSLLIPTAISAQNQGAPPGAIETHRDLEYANVDGKSLTLDLYVPKTTSRPLPIIIWVHGGGWREGNKSNPLVLPLVNLGFAVASINYRLSQEAPFHAHIYDCKAAYVG